MKFSLLGRLAMAMFASLAMGLGMTACGGGTIGYMWVIGQQYNTIAAFKIDDYTGNLTQVIGAPFAAHGAAPVSIVVKPGGRYVYVINQGSGGTSTKAGVDQNVSLFSVGGDGVLTFQQAYFTQGYVSQWAQFDNTGTYLYVLDKYSPSGDGNGAITVFQADSTTGRLSLVTNSQTQVNGLNTTYFEVGPGPTRMLTSGGCLLTLNNNNTISPLSSSTGGQLAFTTTQVFPIGGATNITSINGHGSYVYMTDAGSNTIFGFSIGSNCTLTTLNGGNTANLPGTSNPMYSLIDNTGKYLYVLNQSTTNTQTTTPYSSISAFTINQSNQELQPLIPSPYATGAGPVCMVQDPSYQYLYISNHNDGTVTGKLFDPTTGYLSDLKRGSTFPSVGLAGCLVVSGAVN